MKHRFFCWMDNVLSGDLPPTIEAFNFNLYEGEGEWHVQIIGAGSFSTEDEEWPCDEVFTTGEDVFVVKHADAGRTWKKALAFFISLTRAYLLEGKYAVVLKSRKGVGIGFVDGDLKLLHVA